MEKRFNSKLRSRLRDRFNQLTPREKTIVTASVVLILLFVVIYLLLLPSMTRERDLRRKVKAREFEFRELNKIITTLKRLDKETRSFSRTSDDQDINLFSAIDRIATRCGVVANIEYMKPGSTPIDANRQEEWIEIRMSKITLKELIDLLQNLESLNRKIYIKRLYMKRTGEYLDLVLQPALVVIR